MVRPALDESRVVIEQLINKLFEADFSLHDNWFPLDDWHWLPAPFLSLCCDRAKIRGAVNSAGGRERPHGYFPDRRAEKWGRSRPSTCLCPVAFLALSAVISLAFLDFSYL